MTEEDIQTSALTLWQNWSGSTRIAELPAHCRPTNRADGYAIQAALASLSGQSVFGWKIAATSQAGQQHIGVDGPLAGRLLAGRVIEDGAIGILQPDLSKTGGVTEALRIAAMASAYKLAIHPHTSATGLNMAASVHFLCAIDNPGYYEADVARENLFRDELTSRWGEVGADGCVRPLEGPGLGVEVNEAFLRAHPVIEGPAYV